MSNGPKRVLHVVGAMNRGGAETWLMHLLRRMDRSRCAMDFLVHSPQPGAFDDEIRALGGLVHYGGSPRRLWSYQRTFSRILREYGPYDIVHSHVHHFSGLTLALANRQGVPFRLAHSHNDTRPHELQRGQLRAGYLRTMKALIRRNATSGIACSTIAAEALFGTEWQQDSRWELLPCGIDLRHFQSSDPDPTARQELGIPADAFVMGHVGSFSYQKNHEFLLEIAQTIIARRPDAWLLLVGDGPLRRSVVQRAHDLGIASRVVFAGIRADVPRLMMHAMNVFLLPSHFEGLPLVLVEAQAAGLPCVFSDVIAVAVDRVEHLVRRASLAQPVTAWADAVLEHEGLMVPLSDRRSLVQLMNSDVDITANLAKLETIYRV